MYGSKKHSGFTLIEMIVSLGVFAVVITMAVGALLALVAANQELQEEQIVMTNLSFALDSMTREIRTGSQYVCRSHPNSSGVPGRIFSASYDLDALLSITDVEECIDGNDSDDNYHGLAFIEGGNSITVNTNDRIVYFHEGTTGQIYRRIGNDSAIPITANDIYIQEMEFFVTGTEPVSTGSGTYDEQPAVTIYIAASEEASTPVADWYYLQTTVTQRELDI